MTFTISFNLDYSIFICWLVNVDVQVPHVDTDALPLDLTNPILSCYLPMLLLLPNFAYKFQLFMT